jgi:hypothetical protein
MGLRREDTYIGQEIIFGRTHGQKTLGVIVKRNPKKAKVRILEDRGRKSVAGQEWGVPYSMMVENLNNVKPAKRKVKKPPTPSSSHVVMAIFNSSKEAEAAMRVLEETPGVRNIRDESYDPAYGGPVIYFP